MKERLAETVRLMKNLANRGAMKKLIYSLVLIAAAAISLVGCKQDIPESIVEKSHKVKIVADREFTKTSYSIDGSIVKYAWSSSDEEAWELSEEDPTPEKFFIFEGNNPATSIYAYLEDKLMTIEAEFSGDAVEGATYSGYFNSGVASEQLYYVDGATLVYDQNSDVMVASETTLGEDGTIQFCFKRLVSFAQLKLNNIVGATVSEVKLVSKNSNFAGDFNYGTTSFDNQSNEVTITTDCPIEDGSATVVAVLLPTDTDGFDLTVITEEVNGKTHTYAKEISKSFTFGRGNVKGLNVELKDCEVVDPDPQPAYVKVTSEPEDWCGEYLIVYEGENVAFDGSLSTLDAVSNTKPVTIVDGKIAATDNMKAIQFTVDYKTGSTSVYNLKSASGYYISGTTTKAKAKNGLKSAENDEDYEISFTIEEGNAVVYSKSSDQNMILRYNDANDQTRFRFYNSGQKPISLYKLEGSIVTKYNVECAIVEGGTVSASTAKAAEGAVVILAATPATGYEFESWNVTNASTSEAIIVSDNKFTMPAANVIVSATFKTIPISDKTIAQFIAAKGGDCYLTGVVSNIQNTTYGNFDLTDESGTIFVYGCLTPEGEAKKFSTLGVEVGDKIKVHANEYEHFNGTDEAKNVVFVEIIKKATKYNVAVADVILNGTVTVNPTQAVEGQTVTITATPASGYKVKSVSAKTASGDALEVTNNQFTMPAENVTVSAEFEEDGGSKTKDYSPKYTLTPIAGSNNSYTGNCDVEVQGITWNVSGNAQQLPWRLGGKSITDVDRAVYSKTAYAKDLWKVSLTVGSASSITVNSLKLVYSTKADFSDEKEVSGTFAESSTIDFEEDFPANCYYKFVFNLTVNGSSNKFVQFSKVEFFGYNEN